MHAPDAFRSVIMLAAFFTALRADAQQFNGFPLLIHSMGESINSSADDYAPAVIDLGSSLFFTSSRILENRGGTDAFLTRWTGTGWFSPVNLGPGFNTEQQEGTLAFAGGGATVVFSADNRDDGFGKTDLYIGTMVNGRPAGIRNLGSAVNSSAWDGHPTISSDGRTLVFASNRRGGYGGTDLWISRLDSNGTWQRAFPLSGLVNTRGDELSPFLAADGATLYFASNGRDGYGGLDLWVTRDVGGDWTQPVNLGPTINSPRDDLFLSTAPDAGAFYLSSSRKGGSGGLDLYRGTPDIFSLGVRCLPVSVRDSVSHEPVSATLRIRDGVDGPVVQDIDIHPCMFARDVCLPAQRPCALEVLRNGRPVARRMLTLGRDRAVDTLRIFVAPEAQDAGKSYDTPLFLDGSYRPNTTQGLEQLVKDLDGPLARYAAIERPEKRGRLREHYRSWAAAVETLCRRLYTVTADRVFPGAASDHGGKSRVEITVSGYPDPKSFTGVYADTLTARFLDGRGRERVISRGDTLDNEALAGLRSVWAAELFDRLFEAGSTRGKAQYLQMRLGGRISWRLRAEAATDVATDPSVRRRVRVIMRLFHPGASSPDPSDPNGEVVFDSHTDLVK